MKSFEKKDSLIKSREGCFKKKLKKKKKIKIKKRKNDSSFR